MIGRYQKVVVIRRVRDGKFYCSPKGSLSPSWTDDIRLANVIPQTKVKGLIRATWGRDLADYEVIEVVPSLPEQETAVEVIRKNVDEVVR